MQHDVQALLNEVPMHTAVNNGGPRGASWGWISSSATSNNYGGEIFSLACVPRSPSGLERADAAIPVGA
jgi:hypothetical protein